MPSAILCRATAPAVLALAAFAAVPALAAGNHSGGHGHQVGAPGNAAEASRTVHVTMRDNHYEPEEIRVKAGKTVRFVVRNAGSLVHEFNIGTANMHAAHQDEMITMVEHGVLTADEYKAEAAAAADHAMGHDHANSVLLEPGETGEVVWTFPSDGTLEFACNVPGHYQDGMVGDLDIAEN